MMVSGKSVLLLGIMLISLFSGCLTEIESIQYPQESNQEIYGDDETISIACWNLQIFGKTKASNETLIEYYAEKLEKYDIFIIQEIRDASGDAIDALAARFPHHQYIISNRAGQSSSKEQYAVFYNNQTNLIASYDYQSEYQYDMQRPPLKCTFSSNNWTFTIYTIHTQPNNVDAELTVMETLIDQSFSDTIILGDLNADGKYYDEDNKNHFTDWIWVVGNEIDTTVAASDNTYDRILINNAAQNNFISFGIMDDVSSNQSDHYLVYGFFSNKTP